MVGFLFILIMMGSDFRRLWKSFFLKKKESEDYVLWYLLFWFWLFSFCFLLSLHRYCSIWKYMICKLDCAISLNLSFSGDSISLPFFVSLSQVLRLHLDYYDPSHQTTSPSSTTTTTTQRAGLVSLRSGILAAGVVLAGVAVVVYLKRAKLWDFVESCKWSICLEDFWSWSTGGF